MTATISKQKQIVKNAENTEYTAEGVHYSEAPKQFIKVNHGRVIKTQPAPRIYVNDGSNGSNLVYSESYKLYTTSEITPRVTSSYSKYGESGGFSDYETIRIK